MSETCAACDKPIILINIDKARGVVGLTQAWVHRSRRANRSHRVITREELSTREIDGE